MEIIFTPREYRYYYDCVRIQVEDDDPMLIPIHAYPVVGTVEVPRNIDFGQCSIGQPITRQVPMRCSVPINCDFEVHVTAPDPAFTVGPARGTIVAKQAGHLAVTYTPGAYCTSTMTFEVCLVQPNAVAVRCVVSGHSRPKAAIAATPELTVSTAHLPRPPPSESAPACPTRSRRIFRTPAAPGSPPSRSVPSARDLRGMRGVNTVLNQKGASLLAPASCAFTDMVAVTARGRQETLFLAALKTKPGATGYLAADDTEQQAVLTIRQIQNTAYRAQRGYTTPEAKAGRTHPVMDTTLTRSVRCVPSTAPVQRPTFENTHLVPWQYRKAVLDRFIHAVRRVILRWRILQRLYRLQQASSRLLHLKATGAEESSADDGRTPNILVASLTFPVFGSTDLIDLEALKKGVGDAPLPELPVKPLGFLPLPAVLLSIPAGYKAFEAEYYPPANKERRLRPMVGLTDHPTRVQQESSAVTEAEVDSTQATA